MTRRLTWGGVPETPPPKRPYRDTLILYSALAVLIVVVAWLTGGGLRNAVEWAVVFFVVATAWSFWQWRVRLRRVREEGAAGDEESTS
jgi:Flp pilus assembly protein TadB